VVINDEAGREGLDVTAIGVAKALADRRTKITTSRPTPGEFAAAYRAAFEAGATGIVSVHISGKLSGTIEAAHLAAAEVGGAIEVIDSGSTGMGLGFAAIEAQAAADLGQDLAAVRRAAELAGAETDVYFYVDTLEHLRQGGRIGAASKLFGTALSVKPILHVEDGTIVSCDRVRTTAKALDRLVELAALAAKDLPVDVAVQHLDSPDRASLLVEAIRARLGDRIRDLHVTEISATIAAHVGPGVAGIVIHRRSA
jgi:DegV family protein with EDD domain